MTVDVSGDGPSERRAERRRRLSAYPNDAATSYRHPHHPSEARGEARLHVCRHCSGRLCQPLELEPAAHGWRLRIRCPDCGGISEGTFDAPLVSEFSAGYADGLEKLHRDLQRMTEANMAEAAELFIWGLERGLIGPEDF